MMTHNQLRKPNENSLPLLGLSPTSPKSANPQILKIIIGNNDRKTKLMKNNQTALGLSCCIIF